MIHEGQAADLLSRLLHRRFVQPLIQHSVQPQTAFSPGCKLLSVIANQRKAGNQKQETVTAPSAESDRAQFRVIPRQALLSS